MWRGPVRRVVPDADGVKDEEQVMQPEFCGRCGERLDPSDEVIQAVEQLDRALPPVWPHVEGAISIVHADHFPPDITRTWRVWYQGPLHGLRPVI